MLDRFWETIGEDLAKRWLDTLFGPAFLFWAGGLGLFIWEDGRGAAFIWPHWDILMQGAALLVGLLVVFLSSLAMKKMQFPAIQFLEGYWPWPLSRLGSYLVSRNKREFEKLSKELHHLKAEDESGLIASDKHDRLIWLESWFHKNPPSKKELLPTRLGNLLRAREIAALNKYGLNSTVCWPRLWCLLSECLKENLTSSRAALNQSAELWLWGLLFILWTGKSYLAVLISLLWMLVAYRLALQTAAVYGDLVETAFDVHRFALYDALSWERPKNSDVERIKGKELSEFLFRGTLKERILYPESTEKGE